MEDESTIDIDQFIEDIFPELAAEQKADLKPCPPPLADVVLRVLQIGLLEARSAGWSGDTEHGTSQADHLHNLPDLLRRYSPRKMRYYWDFERPAFIRRMGGQPLVFEEIWAELEPLIPKP